MSVRSSSTSVRTLDGLHMAVPSSLPMDGPSVVEGYRLRQARAGQYQE